MAVCLGSLIITPTTFIDDMLCGVSFLKEYPLGHGEDHPNEEPTAADIVIDQEPTIAESNPTHGAISETEEHDTVVLFGLALLLVAVAFSSKL